MVKDKVAPPKCLFHVTIHTEKDQYTLIKQSANLTCQNFGIN